MILRGIAVRYILGIVGIVTEWLKIVVYTTVYATNRKDLRAPTMSAHALNHLVVIFLVLAVKKFVTNDDMFLKVLWKGSWTNKKVVRN